MECQKCGQPLNGDEVLCPNCGAELTDETVPSAEPVELILGEIEPEEEEVTPVDEAELVIIETEPEQAEEEKPVEPKMVSLSEMSMAHNKKKKKSKTKKILLVVLVVFLALVLVAGCAVGAVLGFMESQIPDGEELSGEDVGVNPEPLPSGVTNIALFGLDNRYDNDTGRSDAIIILSVDYDHNKIKMTSIARDTLVKVEGYGWNDNSTEDDWTKITHAFAYGGAKSAVKALNQNFGMNITKYMFVNFHEFAALIDIIGGVEIEVEQREISKMNSHIRGMVSKSGLKIEEVKEAGLQTLSGGQALAYSRLRKIDTDVQRGNRQKAVLEAAMKKVKTMPLTKYPELISEALGICNTNLKSAEILKMATWAATNSPEIIQMSLPDDDERIYSNGGNWQDGHGWVYRMDLDYATAYLHDFIYETKVAENLTPNRPN